MTNLLLAIFADLAEYGLALGVLAEAVMVRLVPILEYASSGLFATA